MVDDTSSTSWPCRNKLIEEARPVGSALGSAGSCRRLSNIGQTLANAKSCSRPSLSTSCPGSSNLQQQSLQDKERLFSEVGCFSISRQLSSSKVRPEFSKHIRSGTWPTIGTWSLTGKATTRMRDGLALSYVTSIEPSFSAKAFIFMRLSHVPFLSSRYPLPAIAFPIRYQQSMPPRAPFKNLELPGRDHPNHRLTRRGRIG